LTKDEIHQKRTKQGRARSRSSPHKRSKKSELSHQNSHLTTPDLSRLKHTVRDYPEAQPARSTKPTNPTPRNARSRARYIPNQSGTQNDKRRNPTTSGTSTHREPISSATTIGQGTEYERPKHNTTQRNATVDLTRSRTSKEGPKNTHERAQIGSGPELGSAGLTRRARSRERVCCSGKFAGVRA